MTKPLEPALGKRNQSDIMIRDEYLRSGKVPFGMAFRKGLWSILTDPWLMVRSYMPGPLGFVLRQRYFRRRLAYMGKGVVFDPGVKIDHPQNIYIDDLAYIGAPCRLVSPEGYIKIGKRCHIGGWILGHEGVDIGDYVASGAIILSITDSHKGGYRMAGPMITQDQRSYIRGKVTIGKDAFLGQYSMILPGVTIGEGAIVGPHSLIISNVKPWTVVIGSPGRVIGKREPVKFPDPD